MTRTQLEKIIAEPIPKYDAQKEYRDEQAKKVQHLNPGQYEHPNTVSSPVELKYTDKIKPASE